MILNNGVVPCDGELIVRSYRCGVYKSGVLGTKADGVVEVTNRRILFQARDAGDENRNALYSEIPISEVSGLSIFKGFSFSFVALVLGALISGMFAYGAFQILTQMTRQHADSTLLKLFLWVVAGGAAYLAFTYRRGPARGLILNAFAIAVFTLLARYAAMSYDGDGKSAIPMLASVVLTLFQLYLIMRFSLRNTIDFQLYSRSTQPSPVAISGFTRIDAKISEIRRSMTSFAPGQDATRMMNELGAVISDIQSMGEFGVEKWTKSGASAEALHGMA